MMKAQPAGSTWTEEQWQAIVQRGEDILVAAAAGSGKTAVLVNRIIERVLDEQEPLDIDRLLVVTFTNAAAAEMRKRIGEALEKALAAKPHSAHLRRQLSLLPRTSISTLHSFCLQVVREHYYHLDLDPNFRLADETEALLLREEVLETLFEEQYGYKRTDFYRLVDCYSSDRSDQDLQNLVQQLYDFSRSYPWPEQWRRQMAGYYFVEEGASIDELPWTTDLIKDIQMQLNGSMKLLEQALQLAQEPEGPQPYVENLQAEYEQLVRLLEVGSSWEALYQACQQLAFGRLKPCKKGEVDPLLQQKVKDLREQAKERVTNIQQEFFLRSPAEWLADLQEMAPILVTLVDIVDQFSWRYTQEKKAKGIVDFSDLEHYCLQVLSATDQQPAKLEQLLPSTIALSYRQKFAEILVDEYQDTNLVQEVLINLICQRREGQGHLFMVGDVKQSIYRFRLAEPGLFLMKYKTLSSRIDLAKNFRSRQEVLAGTNYIFKQIMDEAIGEMDYDEAAQLIYGADYPQAEGRAVEVMLITRDLEDDAQGVSMGDWEQAEPEEEGSPDSVVDEEEELENVQLEARFIAQKIKELISGLDGRPYQIYDKELKRMRAVTYRDIVILLRSASQWAPVLMEEFKQQDIPIYAELQTGYFEAIEVAVMLSLLTIIDNPEQDIPLTAVLRSPIVGLSGEELAQIRIQQKQGSYYTACQAYLQLDMQERDERIYSKLQLFLEQLRQWRTTARRGSLSQLIWKVFRETGYYDFVSGLPGGKQRQANLRVLYDRARQYERTSFRGLFRFLRFIERMRERGGDMGTARSLGEQEDVVRMMTIHKSKGLEFPIVFVAGLGKRFNMRDLQGKFLLHKELGFGSRYVNTELRLLYPTLAQVAIRKRMRLELLAEEMRVFYVALTRAQEKLFLVGTVTNAQQQVEKWVEQGAQAQERWLLPDYIRSSAKTYLDWLMPALLRHRQGQLWLELLAQQGILDWVEQKQQLSLVEQERSSALASEIYDDPSEWQIVLLHASYLPLLQEENEEGKEKEIETALRAGDPLAIDTLYHEEVSSRLNWHYPFPLAVKHRAKQAVSELAERERHPLLAETTAGSVQMAPLIERPLFLQEKRLTATERGTAMHLVMQHVPFEQEPSLESLQAQVSQMIDQELLTVEQAEAINLQSIYRFLQSDLGYRLRTAQRIERELTFSLALPAREAYPDWLGNEEEYVLVQGIMDCVFEEEEGLILVDYKTDKITDQFASMEERRRQLQRRYQEQLELYSKAIQLIWKKQVREKYLYFFDGDFCLRV